MARLINADKYMARLRANIDTTADTIDEQIKKEEPFINKPCISEGVCKVDVTKMLEHIDEEVRNLFEPDDFDNSGCYNEALVDVLEILNSHSRQIQGRK